MKCRRCAAALEHTFLDLGFAPPSNAYLDAEHLQKPELYFPLKVMVCDTCWLVQTQDYVSPEDVFRADYAYFSSTSSSWLRHAARYVEKIIPQLHLTANSFVVEVAANDGYLLRNFVAAGIPCLGIEPTQQTADAAEEQGIEILREFFGESLGARLAQQGRMADLIIGNNVYAHVPDINDFTRGLKKALKPGGTITIEFPHLLRLIEQVQFDTIYHEHFSYLSLYTVQQIFNANGLRVWDVEELPTHGGSLRVYGCHADDRRSTSANVAAILQKEADSGLRDIAVYAGFQAKADRIKNAMLSFLLEQKQAGRTVAGYGAAAKGNTLLNYAGVKPDLLPFVCDAAPAKQGKFLPGSHIPILPPTAIRESKPDFLVILPWNIASEVREQNSFLRNHGTQFVTAIPELQII